MKSGCVMMFRGRRGWSHAADAELAQRAVHAGDRLVGVGAQQVTFSSSGS
jgi:hypothetical protein